MTVIEICRFGDSFRACKIILESGPIFTIDRRKAESDIGWEAIESTTDSGHMANRLGKLGCACDHDTALALL